MERMQASTFDPSLFEEVQKTISEQLGNNTDPDLESHITGDAAQTEEEQNLLHAQFCHEWVNHPLYSLSLQSMMKMVEREHKKFEQAETDPGDRLRINWRAWQGAVTELVGHWESGAEVYRSSLR